MIKGILYRQPGKGTYVAEPPTDMQLVGVTGYISMLATSDEHVFRTRILGKIKCPLFARQLLGLPSRGEVIHLEQITFVRGEPRYIHHCYLPMEVGAAILTLCVDEKSILEILVLQLSHLPAKSRDHLSLGLSNAEEAEQLGIPMNFPVQVQRGVIISTDGKPLEAHKIIIRGDRFKQDIEYTLDQKMIEQVVKHSQSKKEK